MAKIRGFRCVRCRAEFLEWSPWGCVLCKRRRTPANLEVCYEDDGAVPNWLAQEVRAQEDRAPGVPIAACTGVWRFQERLPEHAGQRLVTLDEGGTPLVELANLGATQGVGRLWLKDESRNPTGSWKDRGMAVTATVAREMGASVVAGASSGNAGVSLAAYAARAGLKAQIVMTAPRSEVFVAMLKCFGAELTVVAGREERFEKLQRGIREHGWFPATNWAADAVGSNCFAGEGYKTIAFEIAMQLGWRCPSHVIVPVSYGDGACGIQRGFAELVAFGVLQRLPKLVLARAATSSTIAFSLGRPVLTAQLQALLKHDNVTRLDIADESMLRMQARLGQQEGVFLETSSSAALCALEKLDNSTLEEVVVVGTATGMKDPRTVLEK